MSSSRTVCWESSIGSSYVEHLFGIRNGTDVSGDNPAWVSLTTPIYLATDVATSAVQLPRTLADLTRTLLCGNVSAAVKFGDVQDAVARLRALRRAGDATFSPQEDAELDAIQREIDRSSRNSAPDIDQLASQYRGLWKKLQRDPAFRDARPLSASKGNASFNLPD